MSADRYLRPVGVAVAAAIALALPASASAQAGVNVGPAPDCGCGHVTQYTYDGPTAAATGSNLYLVFVPDSYTGRSRVPLVVVSHGTNTTAAEQEAANNYDQVAEKYGFIVMYPDANDDLHPAEAFQSYSPTSQVRGQGDVALIAGMTRATIARYRIDPQRVYEIGMSAGAIVTSDLAATYPDLYAAVGIMAGTPYGVAGFGACVTGQDPTANGIDPQLSLDARGAYRAEGRYKRVMPVVVLNGDADGTVNPLCDQLATEQWLLTNNLVIDGQMASPLSTTATRVTRGKVPGGYAYEVYDYTQPSGCVLSQHWIVSGMNHDWSGGTGNPAYSGYTDPKGPSASEASWAFFSHYTLRSSSRRCATVNGAPPHTVGNVAPAPASGGGTHVVKQASAQPANAVERYLNQVSVAAVPTSGACFEPVVETPGCLAYSSVALQSAGATSGNEVNVGGFSFQWPVPASGNDSVSPAGQTIPVSAPSGTNTVAILGASEQGQTTGESSTIVDLHYAGGATDVTEVSFPNWDGLVNNGSSTPAANELRSAAAALNSTALVATPASVYAITVPVDPTRHLVSVTFADTDPSIRIFDLQPATTGGNS